MFVFDQLNRLRSVQPATGSTSESPVVLDYTPAGRLLAQIAPNGAHSTHQYDAAGRLRTIVHTQSGVEVARLTYRHDANGGRPPSFEQHAILESTPH